MERKWWTLIVVCIAIFMLLLDITVVNVALPDIERSLGASFSELQWVVDAYSLTLASFLLTTGALADLVGRRRVFCAGLGLFSLASLLCGLAQSAVMLDLARAFQGIGGAIMFSTSLALLAQEFQGRERGTAFGIWGATTGAAVAVGPLVGGALTESLGWEWIFFINVPIGLAGIAVTVSRVRESRNPSAGGIDWPGMVTFSAALFLLVFALIRGNDEGWTSGLILAELIGAAVLLLAFLVIEWRRTDPMLDPRLFGNPTFAGASVVAFSLSSSMFAMFLYLTLYIQNVLAFSPLEAGLRFLPVTLLAFFVAPLAGKLSAVVPVRALLGGGLLLVGSGLLLMGGLSPSSEWTALLAGFLVAGAGVGLVNPPLASTAIGVVSPARSGMASGINNTFRQVGIATGIAALGAIFQHRVESRLTELLAGGPAAGSADRLGEALASGGVRGVAEARATGAREAISDAATRAFVSGMNELFVISGVVALVGAALAFVLIRRRDFVVAPDAAPEPAPAG